MLDILGNIVVKYTYDAYGNCTRGYTTNNDLADSNPIRYRSYYYDEDTGLYYLLSQIIFLIMLFKKGYLYGKN